LDCGKEVHGGDHFPVIAQKGEPTFGPLRISWCPTHPARNGPAGNVETQHRRFTLDARWATGWILGHHPKDEIANFLRNSSPADHPAGFGDGMPIERER
jgi:hypothetical protein